MAKIKEDDPRHAYVDELTDFIFDMEKQATELNVMVEQLQSARRNLFATSEVDIGKDGKENFVSRLEYAKLVHKKAKELYE